MNKVDIEQKIRTIQEFAETFELYDKDENSLFEEINRLDSDVVNKLIDYYNPVLKNFQPVNFLRLEILNLLKEGELIDNNLLDGCKEKIKKRDQAYFKKYGSDFIEELNSYEDTDFFKSWKDPFKIFHTFFLTSNVSGEIDNCLRDIASEIIKELELTNFDYHFVSFKGAQNFGTTSCWIAIYPATRTDRSHFQPICHLQS